MNQSYSLLDVLKALYRWRKFVVGLPLATALMTSLIVLVVPVYYKSTTTFYAASTDLQKPQAFGATQNADIEYYGTKEDVDRLLSIARSGELVQFLVDSFDLYAHYEIDADDPLAPYYVAETLSDLYKVKKTKEGAVEISVEDTDRELAARMANAARAHVNAIALRLIKNSQRQLMETYRQSIAEKEAMLQLLADSLRGLREQYGIFSTRSQGEILAGLAARTEARLALDRARLQVLQQSRSVPRDTILFLQAQVHAMEEELKSTRAVIERFNTGLAQVEALELQYREINDKLAQDRERLKQIEAAWRAEVPALHLLEPAEPAVVKSRPLRTLSVLVATLAALLFAVLTVLVFEHYRQLDWRQIWKD